MSRWRRQEGFSLIELAVSLSLFAVVVVSLSLMFDRALETGSRGRFDQVGKTLAQERLEELRALPLYIPWTDEARRVDLLDLYYPNTAGTPVIPGTTASFDGTANVWTFTTTETPLVREDKDFVRSTTVQFVGVQDEGTLTPRPPKAGYASDVADADDPGAQAVRLTVNVAWTSQGQSRGVTLDTVIHNIRRGVPNVEASGSILAGQLSGVVFHDGLSASEGTTAEILATVGEASTSFREVTGSESDATADPVDVVERNPIDGALLQQEAPTGGAAASSVPNTTDGNNATDNSSLSAGSVSSLAGVGPLAGWGSSSTATEGNVSALHTLNPEGQASVNVAGFIVTSRDPNYDEDDLPLRMFELGGVAGAVEERSTTSQVAVDSSVDLTTIPASGNDPTRPAVTVWASEAFQTGNPDEYRGVVTIESLQVDARAVAGTTGASTAVDWRVNGLRVWDPEQPPMSGDDLIGGYSVAYNFGFDSTCGGWEDDPLTTTVVEGPPSSCGDTRVDQTKAATENPNPVLIPAAYVGDDGTTTSLSIVAGVTVRNFQFDPTAGSASASVGQKNILSITTRQDVPGATPLSPMLVGVGDASADASYIVHEH
jgi:prepilin-type N-terminal cleavage/methylation domain-containing protein